MRAELILSLPWADYCAGGYLGSSALHAWGSMSLEGWSAEHLEKAYASTGSKYTAGGSALDALLTGDPSGKKIVVKPATYTDDKGVEKPWNGNANACKEWLAKNAENEIIDADQHAEIQAALPRAREAIEVFRRLHGADPIYQATLRGEVEGVKIQTRPDILIGPSVPDLKYVNSQSFASFDRQFIDSRYFLQGGLFYGLGREAGISDPLVSFLLVESGTRHPRVRVAEVSREILAAGWARVQSICAEIAQQRERGFLDAVEIRPLVLPAWAEARL